MDVLTELSLILVVAVVLSGFMRLLRQPLIVGYILTGLLLGPQFLNLFHLTTEVETFSQMGIAILLFIVGLHLSPNEIKDLGKRALFVGFLQVFFTAVFGFLLAFFLKFGILESVLLGLAFSFSSTIIVLKVLSDKKDLEKLYGRLSIGILLFQDIVAAISLIVISTLARNNFNFELLLLLIIKMLAMLLVVTLVSVYVLPILGDFFARSQEYLFLFSLAWGFGIASVFKYLGFSLEIGALIAGIALSLSPYAGEISARLKPLRDFFVVIFFIILGAQIDVLSVPAFILPLCLFLIFILLLKPLIVYLVLYFFKYNSRTRFLTSVSLAQISEFSLILMMLAIQAGKASPSLFALITLLSFISISLSTYLLLYAEKVYSFFGSLLLGKKTYSSKSLHPSQEDAYYAILFGCNRVGYDFIKVFKHWHQKFLAVDFDPEVIRDLKESRINCIYGDAEDSDFLDEISVSDAHVIVSTIPEFETNSFLVNKVRQHNKEAIIIAISYNIDEAIKLYDLGATYVILPHFIGGEFAANLARTSLLDFAKLEEKRLSHIQYLRERKELGHAHPIWESR